MTLPSLIDVSTDLDGLPVVSVTFDLSAPQADAALHALRTIREARYRLVDVSTDDAIALREMTSLVDELAEREGLEGIGRHEASVARLGVLRDALCEFSRAEHIEREGDAAAYPVAIALLDQVEDLHSDAVHAALTGETVAR